LFESKYTAYDGIERNARFNGRYGLSFSGGKEINWIKNDKNRTFGINLRTIYRGGFFETPIDMTASAAAGKTRHMESQAYTIKQADYFRLDVRLYLKKQRSRYTSILALDIQNVTNHQNIAFRYYDAQKREVVSKYQLGLIPVLSYRVEFQRS
jgi:hypothetical protein